MTADRHFKEVLAELSPYLDDLPPPGSAEHLRFDELVAEVASHAAVGPKHPHAEQIQQLGAKIDAVTRGAEGRVLDLTPGEQGTAPMLGGDLPLADGSGRRPLGQL